MKQKLKFFLMSIILLISINSFAQITLEHIYYGIRKATYLTDLGNNDYKYVVQDSNGFSLYNLDHSPYLLNVVPPIPIWQAPGYYNIAYISKTLFDTENTNIEYVVTCGENKGNFYIFRTDGTLLFEKDSVTGPYNIGGFDGSLIQQPIVNTPNGTKLFLQNNNGRLSDSMRIYSLPGKLEASISEVPINASYISIFPNPTNGILNFKINLPNNQEKFLLSIYNSSIQKIDETIINGNNYQLDIRQKALSAGTYLFDLRTEHKVYQTGKFIITK